MSLVLACFLIVPAALPVRAEEQEPFVPLGSDDEYYPVVYDNTNGLPTAEANDIVQTNEGFIWIACYAGLVRYDGHNFVRLDSTEGLSSVACLFVDNQGRLWIGTNDNGVAVMENGEFRFWDEDDGLGSSKVREIEEDGNGYVYVGTTSGITMFSPDLEMTPLTDSRIANVYVDRMVAGTDQLVYCTTNGTEMFILRDGNLVNYYENDESLIEGITAIYPDPAVPGKIYYGTESQGIYHVDIKAGFESAEHIDVGSLYSITEINQVGDELWVCSRGGIGMIDDEGFHDMTDLPLNNSIEHMMVDYEGNLWFVSTRLGVMKLVKNRFSNVFANYGIHETVVNTTCLLDGRMFIGSDTGLTVIDEEGVVDSVSLTSVMTASGTPVGGTDLVEMLDDLRIRSIIRDSKDRLWIATWKSMGLLCYDHGALTIFNEDEGMLSDRVRMVYETKDGRILAAVTGGLNIIEDGKVAETYDKSIGIENAETLTVCEAPNGDILLGSNGDGIYIINDEGLRNVGKKNGLTSGVVMRIKYDESNKVYWLVTGNSLAYMSEDYEVTTIKNFPYPDNLNIYKNDKGDMWIMSSDGIYVVPARELLANGEINPVHYSMANGLPCIATSNAYCELTDNGDLYIAGRTGVAMININEPLEDVNELKMAVPYIEVDDELVYPDSKGVFRIPASANKIAIYGFVYSYSLVDPTVSFRLKGFDKEMMTVKLSELDPIYYTNLKGGRYTFVMELNDEMGRGSKILNTTIIKEKAFYEEPVFYVGVTLFATILLTLLVQYVVNRQLAKAEEAHKIKSERERVSSELHMANQIQTGILPHEFPPFPERNDFDLYALMDPAKEVGGDFYDYFMIDDDHLCLVIADVSGKGIPAALFMMNCKVLLKSLATSGNSPSEVLMRANKEICENNQMEMFVTVWMGILELSTGIMTASNAGHEYPVVGRVDSGFELIKDKHGFVIGGMGDVSYKDYEIRLEPGDKLFVYTDGVPEATNADNEMFGTDRMLDTLNADKTASPETMLKNISEAVKEFENGADKFDDLTMLALEYFGPGEHR